MSSVELSALYGELSRLHVDPASYRAELADAAFEVLSADTFIAGIASTLLAGKRPDAQHMAVLRRDYLLDATWLLSDGRRVDLSLAPELFAHASLVEQVRRECIRCLGN